MVFGCSIFLSSVEDRGRKGEGVDCLLEERGGGGVVKCVTKVGSAGGISWPKRAVRDGLGGECGLAQDEEPERASETRQRQ